MKHYLKIETLIHLVMIVFAVASTSNIGDYLAKSHNYVTSWSIAVSLGFGLVALSIILSKVDSTDKSLFRKMIAATLSVCMLSGTLQMLAYHSHGLNWLLAALFGYGFPLVAEVILALAISAYDLDTQQKKIRGAKQSLYEKSALVLADTVAKYDSSQIQAYMDTQITSIVKKEVDTVFRDIFKYETKDSIKLVEPAMKSIEAIDIKSIDYEEDSSIEPVETLEETLEHIIEESEVNKPSLKPSEKLEAFYSHLLENYKGSEVDSLNISQLAKETSTSWITAKSYIQKLREQNRINGVVA